MEIEEIRNKISELKTKYISEPKKLKYIEAFERSIPYIPVIRTLEAYNELVSGLEDWIDNPLHDEELEMHGFAGLMATIKEYESDTFSSEGAKLTDEEVFQISNKIVDDWVDHYLDGVLIAQLLEDVRSENKTIEE